MRKSFSLLILAACTAMLAGCGDEAKTSFSPVPFHEHDRCHLCGMVISHYEGPKAEVFIKGAENEAVKFCSGRDAFTFALQPENKRRLLAFFIHDMGATEWAKPNDKALISADKAWYAYSPTFEGVMGAEPVAFSKKEDAERFAKEKGGKVYGYDAVTLDLLN